MTKITDKQALDELKRSIDEIDKVRKRPRLSPKFKGWQIETSELLEKVYGRKSKQVKDFDRIPYSLATFSNDFAASLIASSSASAATVIRPPNLPFTCTAISI